MSCLNVPVRLRSAGVGRESSRSWAFTEKTKRTVASRNIRAAVDLDIFVPLLPWLKDGQFFADRTTLPRGAAPLRTCKPRVDSVSMFTHPGLVGQHLNQ